MKLYSRLSFKFALLGHFFIISTLSNAMDTISIKGKKVKLNTLPEWFLNSEAHNNPDHKLRQQALLILKTREEQKLREAEKLTSNCQLKHNDVLPNSLASSSDSESLSKHSLSSQSSLASSPSSSNSRL